MRFAFSLFQLNFFIFFDGFRLIGVGKAATAGPAMTTNPGGGGGGAGAPGTPGSPGNGGGGGTPICPGIGGGGGIPG